MGTGRRAFLKVFCQPAINGQIHSAEIDTRGIFWDLLWNVGDGNLSDYGILGISHRIGYSDTQIAELLNVTDSQWLTAKVWLGQWHGDEKPLIVILDNNVVAIVHYSKFQPEYDRTKKYKHPEIKKIHEEVQEKVHQKVQELLPIDVTPKGTGKPEGRSREVEKLRSRENEKTIGQVAQWVEELVGIILDTYGRPEYEARYRKKIALVGNKDAAWTIHRGVVQDHLAEELDSPGKIFCHRCDEWLGGE